MSSFDRDDEEVDSKDVADKREYLEEFWVENVVYPEDDPSVCVVAGEEGDWIFINLDAVS